jgi:hypothetical protein
MDRTTLKRWQAERLRDAIRPGLTYLGRLRARMEKRGFLPSDRLVQLVQQAKKDLQALFMELHYLSCSSGVGKPRAEP